MKIDSHGRPLPPLSTHTAPAKTTPQNTASTAPKPSVPAGPVDNVNLSAVAQLQSLKQSLGQTPVVNADKVREIKTAISEGKFHINAEAIADSLIENVRDMLADRDHTNESI